MLLTGDEGVAERVTGAVLRSQPETWRLDSAHLDRLTILRCREHEAGGISAEGVPRDIATALAGLPTQQREAWTLRRLYGLPEREAARAMDCSLTATRRHLRRADERLSAALGARLASGLEATRRWTAALDLSPRYRQRRARRDQAARLGLLVALLVAIIGVMWLVDWLSPG